MLPRLLRLAHARAYERARRHSSPLWWAAALVALALARREERGEEREVIRAKPGHRVRVEVTRPTK